MSERSTWLPRAVLAGALCVVASAAAVGQEKPAAAPPPDRAPTLDELLGLDEPEPNAAPAEQAASEDAEQELQRRLDEEALGDGFAIAIRKMSAAAGLLEESFDTGLGTQRIQEEVLERLAHLLDAAKRSQGAASSSSSASSAPRPGEGQPKPAPRRGGKPGSPSPQRAGDPQQERESPPGEAPHDLNRVLEESRREWGTLPQRVREMLLQGRQEKFSSLYERLTREYYRRLAEEPSP